MTETAAYEVAEENAGKRIDKLLAEIIPNVSRSQVQAWIDQEVVTLNGNKVKANHKCVPGDMVAWTIPEAEEPEIEPENIPLDIVYEDSDLIVVNKPKGMVVHPAPGHTSHTLVNALLYHCKDLSGINGVTRPGIVHRIDKDTSGLLVAAKNDIAHASLSEQLANREVERKYEAIVHGELPHDTGLIDAPIGRDPNNRQRMAVVENGKAARTHFKVLQRFLNFTHIECRLETGRTHQIRVHMQYIGHPLAGDLKYGPRKTLDVAGQALHARTLGFRHPDPSKGEFLHFEVEAPSIFLDTLTMIEKMS